MDDPRISRMYLAGVKRWFATLHHTIWRRNLMRSGLVTGIVLACLLIGLTFGYRQHVQGNFHKLESRMAQEHLDAPTPMPGGQEAVELVRTRLMGDSFPEFISATVLPGRGMNVLQIRAYIPGKGEVDLMASPTVEGAASTMTGKGMDADGQASLTMGGTFEAPWAGRTWGTPSAGGGLVTSLWQGHVVTLPAAGTTAMARDGLMLAEPSDSVETTEVPDGENAEAVFHARDFGGRWPSNTDVTITVLLGGRALDLTVTARNVGDQPEPIGIGWSPRFAVLNGNRQQLRLRIPAEMRAEIRNPEKGQPTGALLPVAGTPYDFSARDGKTLGAVSLDDCFVALQQNMLDNGPIAEISDPSSGYGLRITALTPTIKAMHVVAPADGSFVSIGPQFNYPDPFGREWSKEPNAGMVVLQPGESTQWKIRLELFSLDGKAPPM